MPEQADGTHDVAVDSHPRLSGIMDTVNSTLAHGPKTRLPAKFYDSKGRDIIDRIGVEEWVGFSDISDCRLTLQSRWFSGYKESQEYRTIGIGALVGDVVSRKLDPYYVLTWSAENVRLQGMIGSVTHNSDDVMLEIGGEDGNLGQGRGGEKRIQFGLSGCHDTTLAAILSSLGAFEGEKWPPYTSHLAVELFRRKSQQDYRKPDAEAQPKPRMLSFGRTKQTRENEGGISRKTIDELSEKEREKMDGFFVRIRYNDRPITIPGCRLPGKHLEDNESFCTLVSPPFLWRLKTLTFHLGGFQGHM